MHGNLTTGAPGRAILLFSGPMIFGAMLQQLYNVVDTLIVGHFLGPDALAAVGSSFALMTFLTSILLGLCMGSGVLFSMLFGAGDTERLKNSIFLSFVLIGALAAVLNLGAVLLTDPLLQVLQVPSGIFAETRRYLEIIFAGILFTFLYNFFASLLRAMGNSVVPLVFLALSALVNIALDLYFVVGCGMGVAGAALATVLAQALSALTMLLYCWRRVPLLRLERRQMRFHRGLAGQILQFSAITSVQQSIMNFGILLIQGLVNSFGVTVMAAFAAAVKIDAFAYMPVQEFGNAFSTYIAQNHGAGLGERIRLGTAAAVRMALVFCLLISAGVCLFAERLMLIFVRPEELEIIQIGAQYLRIEGACYFGIGCLFLLYGFYRGIGKPVISTVLTVVSLGTRVLLAYCLAPIPQVGLLGIWWAVPIGWVLADLTGLLFYRRWRRSGGGLGEPSG